MMPGPFVPDDFEVPLTYRAEHFHLEPLGPGHNERDHAAWMGSIEHIRSTPGMEWRSWPEPMSLEENLADLEMHEREFAERKSFTYSILDRDEVIGCVYIYPDDDPEYDAHVRSWMTESRAAMDPEVRRELTRWLAESWPFRAVRYASPPS